MLGLGMGFKSLAGAASSGRPFLASSLGSFGRSALVGGVAMTSQRAYSALPDGAQDIGKMVSTASEKLGLGDNQFAAGGFQLALIGGILA